MSNNKSKTAKEIFVNNSKLSRNAEKKILDRLGKTRQQAVKTSREHGLNVNEYINFLNEF